MSIAAIYFWKLSCLFFLLSVFFFLSLSFRLCNIRVDSKIWLQLSSSCNFHQSPFQLWLGLSRKMPFCDKSVQLATSMFLSTCTELYLFFNKAVSQLFSSNFSVHFAVFTLILSLVQCSCWYNPTLVFSFHCFLLTTFQVLTRLEPLPTYLHSPLFVDKP